MRRIGATGAIGLALLVGACAGDAGDEVDKTRDGAPVAPAAANGERTGEAREPLPIVSYKPEDFPFVTIVRDDGEGPAGGWQAANANLGFWEVIIPHLPRHWRCPITIGMPMRTELAGPIPRSHAVAVSVQVTEDVARAMDYDLPQGIFCFKFVQEVKALFKSRYPELGSRVTQ